MYFLLLLTVFIVINLVILRFKKQNWKVLLDWKVIALALSLRFWDCYILNLQNQRIGLLKLMAFQNIFILKNLL